MTNDVDKTGGGPARAGGGNGKAIWIWIVLLVALVAVVAVRNMRKPGPAANASATSGPASGAAAGAAAGGPTETVEAPRGLPRLVDLGAGKCIPCRKMLPILKDLKASYAGKMEVVFIDVWENPDAGKAYGIKLIPTQIFYDASGKERFRHEGFFGKEDILAKWKELGVDLSPGME